MPHCIQVQQAAANAIDKMVCSEHEKEAVKKD